MTTIRRQGTRVLAAIAAALALAGCSDVLSLDVEAPGRIADDDLNTADAVAGIVAGMSYDLSEAFDTQLQEVLMAGGEIWHGGSYDFGTIPLGSLEDEDEYWDGAYGSMSQARWVAENGIRRIAEILAPAAFERDARVARAYKEMFAGLYTDPDTVLDTTFDEQHDELVLVKQIPMYSTCEHHLVSFHGVAHVGYIPRGRIIGISKVARLVEMLARRPQVQERLTSQVADFLCEGGLNAQGAAVVVEAEHLCMTMRGAKKPGSRVVTSATRGIFREDPRTRAEFFSIVGGTR